MQNVAAEEKLPPEQEMTINSNEPDNSSLGPLCRNLIIVIVLLIIAILTVSYLLKRK